LPWRDMRSTVRTVTKIGRSGKKLMS